MHHSRMKASLIMRTIKATLVLLFSLALALTGLASATAQPLTLPTASKVSTPLLKITPAKRSDQHQAGWDTLDHVFNKSPKTMQSILINSDRVAYVGTSAKPIATLPLISFRGKSVGGKMTNHVFVFTKASKHNTIPAYQYSRLAAMLPACKSESSNLCVWDASKRGNGKGKSFIALTDTTTLTKGR